MQVIEGSLAAVREVQKPGCPEATGHKSFSLKDWRFQRLRRSDASCRSTRSRLKRMSVTGVRDAFVSQDQACIKLKSTAQKVLLVSP